jgi:predicted HTH domain antitoxin
MNVITLEIPDKIELDPHDTIKFLSAKLFESGRLSLGQAAELTGLSKIAFAEIIGDYNVSIINYPVSEILQDAARI